MTPRIVVPALLGALLATGGLVLAVPLEIATWSAGGPSVGIWAVPAGFALAGLGLAGPAVSLRWLGQRRPVAHGALVGALAAALPVVGVLIPYLALLATGVLRRYVVQEGGIPDPYFAPLVGGALVRIMVGSTLAAWVVIGLNAAVSAGSVFVMGGRAAPTSEPLSLFPLWIVANLGVLFLVLIAAFGQLGRNLTVALGDTSATLALEVLPGLTLLAQAVAVAVAARQARSSWAGGDRLGTGSVLASLAVLGLVELALLALMTLGDSVTWPLFAAVVWAGAALIGQGLATLLPPRPIARGSEPASDLLARAIGWTMLAAPLCIGLGWVQNGSMGVVLIPLIVEPTQWAADGIHHPVRAVYAHVGWLFLPHLGWHFGVAIVVMLIRGVFRTMISGPPKRAEVAEAAPTPTRTAPVDTDNPFAPPTG